MKKFYLIFALFFGLTFNASAQETVIAVWDFANNSLVGDIHPDFSGAANPDMTYLSGGGSGDAAFTNTDVTGGDFDNSYTMSTTSSNTNGWSNFVLNNLHLGPTTGTPTAGSGLVNDKMHLSLSFKSITIDPTTSDKLTFILKDANTGTGTNHRITGLQIKKNPNATNMAAYVMVYNAANGNGTSKYCGHFGNTQGMTLTDVTIGVTVDYAAGSIRFWINSPDSYASGDGNAWGFKMFNADGYANTSNFPALTATPTGNGAAGLANAVVQMLQFSPVITGASEFVFDQIKISTGEYENTVAAGNAPPAPSANLVFQGIVDFSLPGKWMKGVHLRATGDGELSDYSVGVYNNGGTTENESVQLPAGAYSAGDDIFVWDSNHTTTNPVDVYMNAGKTFTMSVQSEALDGFNGDDALVLKLGADIVETFGEIGVDGTGTAWDYTDTWAYKTYPEGVSTWTYGAVDCTDGSYTTWDSGCTYPFSVDKQETGWDSEPVVTGYSHNMADLGPAEIWYNEGEAPLERVTSSGTPDPNDSESAMKYTDDGSLQYCNAQFQFKQKIDLSQMNTFTMDVYIDGSTVTGTSPNQLALKLQNADEGAPWNNQNVVEVAVTPDVWTTVTFEFNDTASMSRTDVDRIVVQFNSENNFDPVTAYIKNVVGSFTDEVTTPTTAVTFNVDTSEIPGGVGANGMYLGGGVFGGANAVAMSDDDGDGVWSVTVDLETGLSGHYVFLNSPANDSDWGTKEQLGGQSCGDPANFDDRILATVGADPYTLNHCFGNCNVDPDTGFCVAVNNTFNVTFNVDTNNVVVGDNGMFLGDGIFGGSNAIAMSDDDGDGIWSVTVELAEGATGNYAFFKNPGDGGDWGTKENLEGLPCADTANYNNRILDPVTADTTIDYCFGTCDASCGTVVRHAVTFNVDTADITVGASGMFVGGGIFGGSNAVAMSDDDGDGVWSVTVDIPETMTGWYTFYNGPTTHYDWGTKEDLNGLECGDPTNFNDRLLPAITGPMTISYCYGTCETSCAAPAPSDSGQEAFCATGTDAGPTVLTLTPEDITVSGTGTITAVSVASMTMAYNSATGSTTYCPSWFSATIAVTGGVSDGVSITGCDAEMAGLDLTGFTSLTLTSQDNDSWTDTIVMCLTLDVTWDLPLVTNDEAFCATGTDAGPTVLTLTPADITVNAGETITAVSVASMTMAYNSATGSTTYCPSWFSATIAVTGGVSDGVSITGCDAEMAGLDLTGFTSLTLTSQDNDSWTDTIVMCLTLSVTSVEPSCVAPDALTVDAVTADSATVSWTSDAGSFEYQVVVGGEAPAETGTATTDNPLTLTGLSGNTTYDFYVRTVCDGGVVSAWSSVSFLTAPAPIVPDYLNDFATFPGDLWTESQGPFGSPDPTITTSLWIQDGFANDGTTGAAKVNIYTTTVDEYLISPMFDLSAGTYYLNVDAAATEWAEQLDAIWEADDFVALVVTSDAGASWSEMYRWDATNSPGLAGAAMPEIELTGYNDTMFAFFASSDAGGTQDIDFFIDNFSISSTSLGVDDNQGVRLFSYYPNPVNDQLTIRAQKNVDDITVYNMLGQVVLSQKPNSLDCTVDMAEMQAGAYFVKVSIDNSVETVRVLKK